MLLREQPPQERGEFGVCVHVRCGGLRGGREPALVSPRARLQVTREEDTHGRPRLP